MSDTAISEKPPASQASTNQPTRCFQAGALIAIWMTLGWLFRLSPDGYLVLGVPLVVLFQLLVRRQPLVTLWVRDATRFRLNPYGTLLGLGLAVLPTVKLIQTLSSTSRWSHLPEILWFLCCLVGAFGAAFSFSRFTKKTWRDLGFCVGTAGTIGCTTMLLGLLARQAFSHHASMNFTWASVQMGLGSFLLYVPVCFVVEEVAFRGALDAHVFQPGDKGQWWTAFFVSTFWGWWHLPIVDIKETSQLVTLIILLPCIHIAIGVFLSLGWRRSGNLAVPATVHAFIDAVRNMLLH